MFVDTHCHLIKDDIEETVREAIRNKVIKILGNSSNVEEAKELIKISKIYDEIEVAIGVHPSEIATISKNYLAELRELIENNDVVAIGEIGLDYHYIKDNKNLQVKIFKEQLDLAKEYNLPVIIHDRDATKDIIDILKEYKLKGVIHCYGGSLETAKELIKMGFLLGIGGVLTFKNAQKLVNVVKNISLEYIILETDSPYLAPEPYRGKTNAPKYIPIIAKKIAEIKNITVKEVGKITTSNAQSLFDF